MSSFLIGVIVGAWIGFFIMGAMVYCGRLNG